MSIGMLVHEASVLVVIVNAMRLMRNDRNSTAMAKELRTPKRKPTDSNAAAPTHDSTKIDSRKETQA